jgi:preprotein translocase subunit SecB
MADNQNGAAAQSAAERQLVINAQYIKDLSFENPRAPHSLMQQQQQQQPEVSLGIDVNAKGLAQDVYEVALVARAEAKAADEAVFVVELTYCAVVSLQNVPQDQLGYALLVEAPRLMFPFARAVIANATREGGFPPLMLHPIDFAELWRRRQEAQEAQQGAAAASDMPIA